MKKLFESSIVLIALLHKRDQNADAHFAKLKAQTISSCIIIPQVEKNCKNGKAMKYNQIKEDRTIQAILQDGIYKDNISFLSQDKINLV